MRWSRRVPGTVLHSFDSVFEPTDVDQYADAVLRGPTVADFPPAPCFSRVTWTGEIATHAADLLVFDTTRVVVACRGGCIVPVEDGVAADPVGVSLVEGEVLRVEAGVPHGDPIPLARGDEAMTLGPPSAQKSRRFSVGSNELPEGLLAEACRNAASHRERMRGSSSHFPAQFAPYVPSVPIVEATAAHLRGLGVLSSELTGDLGFRTDRSVRACLYRYGPRPGIQNEIEFHQGYTQTFLPLDGDLMILLGPNGAGDPSEPSCPSELTAYIIPQGCNLTIGEGTWHDFPMARDGQVTVFTTVALTLYDCNRAVWGDGDMHKVRFSRPSWQVPPMGGKDV